LVKFGDDISEDLHQQVFSFSNQLLQQSFNGIKNVHPGYNSVLVTFDKNISSDTVLEKVQQYWGEFQEQKQEKYNRVEIPVLYGAKYGPDLDRVCEYTGLSSDEVIKRHTAGNYLVYFIGFSPGFPYIGGMDETLATPRLDTPRKKVPLGSVAVANNQTGIYPIESPGGWNLIGRTPLPIFNINDPENSLVDIGDKLHFCSISQDEFYQMKGK
jgi:inhibitor of KinA|tara:strand:+ start:130 stop:768 length:639 start_codon:yes stop_codon:yes gene_type:complete